jgi:sterol desaturase/sphingolipid hydroxylase (fatty acid hydroxylase superfamily)
MPYPEPTLYAIPFFLLTLALEPWLLARLQRGGRAVRGYEGRDTWASLGMGIGSLFFVSFINLGIYAIASCLWRHRLLDLGHGALGWAAALVGWDLAYYWNHRIEHENRVLWACHVNHHSSRLFNFSTALRQPWTPFAGWLFYPGLALLGVAPAMIMISAGINLVYQYWVHTETIDRMPRWFEAIFNTPSHHRVHHGSNREYLTRTTAGSSSCGIDGSGRSSPSARRSSTDSRRTSRRSRSGRSPSRNMRLSDATCARRRRGDSVSRS